VKRRRPTYLELGKRQRFGREAQKPTGPIVPPPRPEEVAPFDVGTWHVEPALARMSRGGRAVELDQQVLSALLILATAPAGGVNRDQLILSIYGPAGAETHSEKIRRVLGTLRRLFSEDGSVRLVNAAGDCYALETGEPHEERTTTVPDAMPMLENPAAIDGWLRRRKPRALAIGLAGVVVVALSIALIAIIDRRQGVLYGRVAGVAVLASEPGRQLSPSFAQDGRQLVYAWRKPDGSEKLYVRAVGGGAARPLTRGDGRDRFPAWSPTGGLIAFQRVVPGGCSVMVVAADGGEPRRVADCDFGGGGPMTWLRDGNSVTFTHRTAWDYPTQIVSANVNDGKMIGVTNPVTGMPGDSQPSLASTGRRLAFVRTRTPGSEDVTLLELGGGAPERLTRDALPLAGLAWEPRGLSLVVASPRGGYDALWRLRLDGATPPVPVLRRGEPLRHPAVSVDGSALAYEHWHVTSRFVVHGPNPAETAPATWREGDALDRGAQLSPDHRQSVFASNHAGREQLWLAGGDGRDPVPLTRSKFDYLETPRYSPDGSRVAFGAFRDGHFGVWVVDVASGQETRAGEDGDSRAPSFSRDGRWLYYSSNRNGGRWQLYRRAWPLAGAAEQLTQEGGFAALESTDGELLYFVRPDRRGLWRRSPAPGGDDTLVTPELAPVDWRNWDVARDAVWFVMRSGGDATLARFVFATGRVSPGPVVEELLPDSGLAVTADGRGAIVAETADAQVDIEVATLE
jgi:Tol biopolymer transport system component